MSDRGHIALVDRPRALPTETEWLELKQALLPKLPDRLTLEQKRDRVHNLLQVLRRSGSIVNQGTRSHPAWAQLGRPVVQQWVLPDQQAIAEGALATTPGLKSS